MSVNCLNITGMEIRETRVFVPVAAPFMHNPWPNIAGYVLRPIIEYGRPVLSWFWFSKYAQPITDPDLADCDPTNFPAEYYWGVAPTAGAPLEPGLVSCRFRYSVRDTEREAFEDKAKETVARKDCIARYFRDWIPDLGGDRFTDIDDRRQRRAEIVVAMIQNASELVLHSLIEPSTPGREYSFEGKAFNVPHHLVSNITEKPG